MIFIGKYKGKPIFKNNYDEYFIRYDGELYMYLSLDSVIEAIDLIKIYS